MTSGESPIRALPLSETVYMAMHGRIMRGDYGANEKLPAEKELSVHFGVSRPVLRSAIEKLRNDGLVYSRQGAGNFVRGQKSAIGYAGVKTIADIQRCYEFRLGLEREAAGLSAARRNDAMLDKMREAYELLHNFNNSVSQVQDADFAFHIAIAVGANNSYYVDTLQALRHHIYAGMKLHGEPVNSDMRRKWEPSEVSSEHRTILDAVVRQDVQAARDAMQYHIVQSRSRLFGATLLDLSA